MNSNEIRTFASDVIPQVAGQVAGIADVFVAIADAIDAGVTPVERIVDEYWVIRQNGELVLGTRYSQQEAEAIAAAFASVNSTSTVEAVRLVLVEPA